MVNGDLGHEDCETHPTNGGVMTGPEVLCSQIQIAVDLLLGAARGFLDLSSP